MGDNEVTGLEALQALRDGKQIKRSVWSEDEFILFRGNDLAYEGNRQWPFGGLFYEILIGLVKYDDWKIVE